MLCVWMIILNAVKMQKNVTSAVSKRVFFLPSSPPVNVNVKWKRRELLGWTENNKNIFIHFCSLAPPFLRGNKNLTKFQFLSLEPILKRISLADSTNLMSFRKCEVIFRVILIGWFWVEKPCVNLTFFLRKLSALT